MVPKLNEVDFGIDDANLEYAAAKRTGSKPAYVSAFVNLDAQSIKDVQSGRLWLIQGLKGTGKTALLRYIAETSQTEHEYLVFRDEVSTEEDLGSDFFPIVIEENKLHNKRHYLHVMKRIVLSIILARMNTADLSEEELTKKLGKNAPKNFWQTIKSSSVAGIVQNAFEGITEIAKGLKIDTQALLPDGVSIDLARLLKAQNSSILNLVCERQKLAPKPLRIFIDEIHFAYKEADSYRADAILVRDLILAASNLNHRFAVDGVDIIVYLGIRSEFLEHPIISSSEVSNVINAAGHSMTWATYPYTKDHPCFDVIAKRIFSSTSQEISKRDVSKYYLANVSTDQFLRGIYGKPREIIRFFNIAKRMFGAKTTLSATEISAVVREFSNQSWRDTQASLSSFLPEQNLLELKSVFRQIASIQFSRRLLYKDAAEMIRPVWAKVSNNPSTSDFEHFMHVLYVIGVFQTTHSSDNGLTVYHSYYRGNYNPSSDGDFMLSDAVARHFA